jgi:hypothetical protein
VKLAIDRGWTVQVISTQAAFGFFDPGARAASGSIELRVPLT